MKRTEYLSVSARLFGVALLAAAAHASAMAQAADTKTLSGKSGSGKVMTREELRACMKQQESLNARKAELESRQTTLTTERAEVQKETDAIKTDQAALMSRKDQIDALNKRMVAFSAKVQDVNQRQADFDRADRSGPSADRERRLLAKDGADLKKEEADLNAERERLIASGEQAAAALNARVDAQQKKAQTWNDNSKQLTKDQQTYEDDRVNWIDSCANRRYKEDDEKAIKAGK